jgi:hypothetical protein
MGSPKAQHEFVVELIITFPWLVHAVAGIANIAFLSMTGWSLDRRRTRCLRMTGRLSER